MLGLTVAATAVGQMVTSWNNLWVLLLLGAGLLAFGLWDGRTRQSRGFRWQAAAMLVLGLLSVVALLTDPFLGSLLVAAGLVAHAGWDFYHHRRSLVVSRSLAEFCFVFDTLLAIAIILSVVQD